MLKSFLVFGALALTAGCVLFPDYGTQTKEQAAFVASAKEYALQPPPPATVFTGTETTYQKNYKLNERMVVKNGESMIRIQAFKQHNYIHSKMLLEKGFELKTKLDEFEIKSGEYPILGMLDYQGETFYVFAINSKMRFVTNLEGAVQPFVLYHSPDSANDKVSFIPEIVTVSPKNAVLTRVTSFRENAIPSTDYEIMYDGIKNDKISLFYKYSVPGTNGGKGSFDTYTYPLNTTMISLKGVLFRVLRADNEQIEMIPLKD